MESHGRINSGPHASSLSPAGSSGRFGRVIKGSTHVPSAKLGNQVSVHRTLRPLLGPPRTRSLYSTSLPYRGYVGGPAVPACTVSGCRGAAQPSRPTGEGRDGTGPSRRYEGRVCQPLHNFAQEKRWVTTNLGSAHLELGLS